MEKLGDVEYDYKPRADGVTIDTSRQILWKGQDIRKVIPLLISQSILVSPFNPYDRSSKRIHFNPEIQTICNDIFPIFAEIRKKNTNADIFASASMASYLFEQFTYYWNGLLSQGQDILGIRLWEYALDITEKWEEVHGEKIHKGTPYFFLAENYLLVGDRDLAFAYLMMGFQGDKILGDESGRVNDYPWGSPGYLTVIMSDNPNNQMLPLVLKPRNYLNQFISKFQKEFDSKFSLQDFDNKFLKNRFLVNFVLFFQYNFFYIYDLKENTKGKYLQDDFSKLRGLDVFLNLAIIIDEVLKEVYQKNKGNLLPEHYISTGIQCLNTKNNWMRYNDLECFWGQNSLWGKNSPKFNKADPDDVMPILLRKSATFNNKPVPKEVFTLLVAYKFRNYGAHNIKQQNTVVANYEEIIENLLYSLFLSIENL